MSIDIKTLRQKHPEAMAAIQTVAATQMQKAHDLNPTAKGDAKAALVVDKTEQMILDAYRFTDTFLYDLPPIVDLAVEFGVPRGTEFVEMVTNLRPIYEAVARGLADQWKQLGWFDDAE